MKPAREKPVIPNTFFAGSAPIVMRMLIRMRLQAVDAPPNDHVPVIVECFF